MEIKLNKLSNIYTVKALEINDINSVYELFKENKKYFAYSKETATLESVTEAMSSLPPGKELCDKFFVGFYENDELLAVLDFINGYPVSDTAYIGLFITAIKLQGKGIGSKIIEQVISYFKQEGFLNIKLGVIKENVEALGFWHKNGFEIYGDEIVQEKYIVVPMKKSL